MVLMIALLRVPASRTNVVNQLGSNEANPDS